MPADADLLDRLRALIAATDPLLLDAVADVDRTLIRSYLRLGPWERLQLGAEAAETLQELARCRRFASRR